MWRHVMSVCRIFTNKFGNRFPSWYEDMDAISSHLRHLNGSLGKFCIFMFNEGMGKHRHVTPTDVTIQEFNQNPGKCFPSWYYCAFQIWSHLHYLNGRYDNYKKVRYYLVRQGLSKHWYANHKDATIILTRCKLTRMINSVAWFN